MELFNSPKVTSISFLGSGSIGLTGNTGNGALLFHLLNE